MSDPARTTPDNPATSSDTADNPLRDRVAAAIYERNNPAHRWASAHPDDLLAYGFDADAALAALQPELDRLAKVRDLRDDLRGITGARWIADALDTIIDGPKETEPAGSDGPSVREAAADDRAHWNAKYAGEGA